MKRKKSRFWTFCFSLIPGAAEMYMGFMKMGLSLMAIFFGLIAVATVLELGPVVFIALIAWFYSFFHAQNIAHMTDENFEAMEDEYLVHFMDEGNKSRDFMKSYRKVIAAVLILIGVILTWQSLLSITGAVLPSYIYYALQSLGYRLPRLVVGIAIIILGVMMIRGKKQELDNAAVDDDIIDAEAPQADRIVDMTDISGEEH